MRDPDRVMRRPPYAFLAGLSVPILAISLIFGSPLVGAGAIVLGAVAFALAYLPGTAERMDALLASPQGRQAMAGLIPVLAVAGIFGNDLLMGLVLALALVALVVVVFAAVPGVAVRRADPAVPAPPEPVALQALPAQAAGEVVTPIDLRALCAGLPSALAGEVVTTVEHLEKVAVEAQKSGDTRRAYDARQGLQDYLPNTISAWKAQPADARDLPALQAALAQVREIAGPEDWNSSASTTAWETQQRFLAARSEKKGEGR